MAQHLLGGNTVVEEDGNGDTVIKNTANGNEIQLDTIIELIGSDVSLEDDDKLFVGSGTDWSIRYDSAGSFVLRDENTGTDVLTADDGVSAIEFARALGTSSNRIPESFFAGVDTTTLDADTVTATDGTLTTSPTSQDDIVNKSYVDSVVQGLDWQESVLSEQNDPPGSPSTGDRYLVDSSPTGAWVGQADSIAEWDGSQWVFSQPDEGFAVFVEDNSLLLYQNGAWIVFGSAIDHGALAGLTDDDHTQYILVDGSRAFSGDINAGSNDLTNVNNADTESVTNKDYSEDVPTNTGSGTITLDLSAGNVHRVEATGDITLEVSNVSSTPPGNSILIKFTDSDGTGPHTISYGTSFNTILWDGGNVRDEIPATSNLRLSFETDDGGSNWWAIRAGGNFA